MGRALLWPVFETQRCFYAYGFKFKYGWQMRWSIDNLPAIFMRYNKSNTQIDVISMSLVNGWITIVMINNAVATKRVPKPSSSSSGKRILRVTGSVHSGSGIFVLANESHVLGD